MPSPGSPEGPSNLAHEVNKSNHINIKPNILINITGLLLLILNALAFFSITGVPENFALVSEKARSDKLPVLLNRYNEIGENHLQLKNIIYGFILSEKRIEFF